MTISVHQDSGGSRSRDDDDGFTRYDSGSALSGTYEVEMRTVTSGSGRSASPMNFDDEEEDELTELNRNLSDQTADQHQHTKTTSVPFLDTLTATFTRVVDELSNDNAAINQQAPFTGASQIAPIESIYRIQTSDQNLLRGKKPDGVPFKDYAPHVFRYLRQQIYGISDEEYMESVRPPDIKEQTKLAQEKFSEGRSGAFFFFTHDNKYIIKTLTKSEATLLLKILPNFVRHFKDNPSTLINRIFGLHSITMYNLTIYFQVLENIFVEGTKPHEMYDIKGSWIDRHTNHHVESGKLMKDQDLHKTLKLVAQRADELHKQLRKDSKFLMQQNIMDYSVLPGIYYVGIDPSDVQNDRIMQQHHDNANDRESNYV